MSKEEYNIMEEIEDVKFTIRDFIEIIKELDACNRYLEEQVFNLEEKVNKLEKLYGGVKGYNEVVAYIDKYLDYTSINILDKIE